MWRNEWYQRWRNENINEDEWPLDELPVVFESDNWIVKRVWRRTACENRPGLKKIYVYVRDKNGGLLGGIKIRMDVAPSDTGTAFDHPNIWQLTGSRVGRRGYWEWNHLGVPTRYMLWIEDELLIENIRTDLVYEYCNPGRWPWQKRGYNAINKPGVYSYDIEFRSKI